MMSLTPRPLNSIPASPLAIGTIRTYGTGMFGYGIAVIIQGSQRWSGAQFATVTAIADPWKWGLVIAVLGALIVVGSLTGLFLVRNIGLYGSAAWLGMFAISILDVARNDSHVSYAGSIFYATLAVGMCWVARAREGRPNHAGFTSRA